LGSSSTTSSTTGGGSGAPAGVAMIVYGFSVSALSVSSSKTFSELSRCVTTIRFESFESFDPVELDRPDCGGLAGAVGFIKFESSESFELLWTDLRDLFEPRLPLRVKLLVNFCSNQR